MAYKNQIQVLTVLVLCLAFAVYGKDVSVYRLKETTKSYPGESSYYEYTFEGSLQLWRDHGKVRVSIDNIESTIDKKGGSSSKKVENGLKSPPFTAEVLFRPPDVVEAKVTSREDDGEKPPQIALAWHAYDIVEQRYTRSDHLIQRYQVYQPMIMVNLYSNLKNLKR